MPETEKRTARDLAQAAVPDVIAGGISELVAHVLGIGPAAAALAPALEVSIRTLREADRRQYQQIAEAIRVATDALPQGADLEQLALADPARTELFRRVVQAAGRSPLEEKIPALGRVLAGGLSDDAKIDEALLLASALAGMEAPHVRLLHQLQGNRDPDEPDAELRLGNTGGQLVGHIGATLPQYRPLLPALLETLRGLGLIEDVGTGTDEEIRRAHVVTTMRSDARWRPTALGRLCHDLLSGVGDAGATRQQPPAT